VQNALALLGSARVSRVASASRDRELFFEIVNAVGNAAERKDCFGVTPKPARGPRALPDYANTRETIRRAVGGIVRARIRG
jgi:hypothetical protein